MKRLSRPQQRPSLQHSIYYALSWRFYRTCAVDIWRGMTNANIWTTHHLMHASSQRTPFQSRVIACFFGYLPDSRSRAAAQRVYEIDVQYTSGEMNSPYRPLLYDWRVTTLLLRWLPTWLACKRTSLQGREAGKWQRLAPCNPCLSTGVESAQQGHSDGFHNLSSY